jgi:hypothetical protein
MRRLTAAKSLGWESIEVFVKEDLTELQKQELELEEDIKRKDRSWQEKCLAYLKLHRLRGLSDPKWSKTLLAACLGASIGHISECLSVAVQLEKAKGKEDEFSKRLWSAMTFTEAVNFFLQKHVQASGAERERRRQVALKNPEQAAILLKQESPALSTASLCESVQEEAPAFEDAIASITLHPKRELSACFLAFVKDEIDYASLLEPVQEDGCGIIWCRGFGWFNHHREQLKKTSWQSLSYPLIWETSRNACAGSTPFPMSYNLGLFVEGPKYKNARNFRVPSAVINCPEDGDSLPLHVVAFSLDALCAEQENVWLPYGGPLCAVAMCERTPVFENLAEAEVEKLREHYRSVYGTVVFS